MMAEKIENINDVYFEVFGSEPVITGINYATSGDLTDRLIEAIETGIPYIEQELPKKIDA